MSRQANETKPIKHICAGLLAHVYGAITTGVTAREAAGIPEGSRLPGICHLTGTAQVIPHNRNLPPVKVWRAVRRICSKL